MESTGGPLRPLEARAWRPWSPWRLLRAVKALKPLEAPATPWVLEALEALARFLAEFPETSELQGPLPCECQPEKPQGGLWEGPERPLKKNNWRDASPRCKVWGTLFQAPELPRLPASARSPCSTAPGSLSLGV